VLEERLSRTEQISELYRQTLAQLEALYACFYQQGDDTTLAHLSDQLHVLIQMEPQSPYSLDGYDPRFVSVWEAVQQAFLKIGVEEETDLQKRFAATAAAMDRWIACITEVQYDEFLRLQDEEFAEARERNKDVQAGDMVVLLKSIWLYGESDMDTKSPDIPFGTPVEVVHRGPAENDPRDAKDYVTINVGSHLPHFSVPWTIVMPLDFFNQGLTSQTGGDSHDGI
jgi:hypothetical protein